MKAAKIFLLLSLIVAGASLGFVLLQAQSGLANAERLALRSQWAPVRVELKRYLWLHPRDARARLLMAEALVKDQHLPDERAVQDALNHLAQVPDSSDRAAEARLQEARLRFLLLHQPGRAEPLLRRAIELDREFYEAYYLLWKLLDLTGRSHLAEPIFWRAYELTPVVDRAVRLREWYMSQFFPASANPHLDEQLGFPHQKGARGGTAEFKRFVHFQKTEPDAPVVHAALARWFHSEGDPRYALKILEEAESSIDHAPEDAFFVATMVAVLFDLGEFQRADAWFARWPESPRDHEFWKWRAIVTDEVRTDPRGALQAYDRALAIWPGHVDWRLRFRKAQCLARTGDHRAAEDARIQTEAVESLMGEKLHARLRAALAHLDDPQRIQELIEFYQALGRNREADCWREHIRRLQRDSPPVLQPNEASH